MIAVLPQRSQQKYVGGTAAAHPSWSSPLDSATKDGRWPRISMWCVGECECGIIYSHSLSSMMLVASILAPLFSFLAHASDHIIRIMWTSVLALLQNIPRFRFEILEVCLGVRSSNLTIMVVSRQLWLSYPGWGTSLHYGLRVRNPYLHCME